MYKYLSPGVRGDIVEKGECSVEESEEENCRTAGDEARQARSWDVLRHVRAVAERAQVESSSGGRVWYAGWDRRGLKLKAVRYVGKNSCR
jgi:hypothetical protein